MVKFKELQERFGSTSQVEVIEKLIEIYDEVSLQVKRDSAELESIYRKCPKEEDSQNLISQSSVFFLNGEFESNLLQRFQRRRTAPRPYKNIRFTRSKRNSGVPSISRVLDSSQEIHFGKKISVLDAHSDGAAAGS